MFATMAQTESRVRSSAEMTASRARSQPGVAPGQVPRMVTASFAAPAVWLQRNRSAGGRPVRAAACNRQRVTDRAWARQKLAFSTPDRPASGTNASARTMAACGCSQPRVSDQRRPGDAGSGPARPWGSKTMTGPRVARASRVTARLSGRVEVVTTAPGASRSMRTTSWRPFPDRGGPSTSIESSTLAQHLTPREAPS